MISVLINTVINTVINYYNYSLNFHYFQKFEINVFLKVILFFKVKFFGSILVYVYTAVRFCFFQSNCNVLSLSLLTTQIYTKNSIENLMNTKIVLELNTRKTKIYFNHRGISSLFVLVGCFNKHIVNII